MRIAPLLLLTACVTTPPPHWVGQPSTSDQAGLCGVGSAKGAADVEAKKAARAEMSKLLGTFLGARESEVEPPMTPEAGQIDKKALTAALGKLILKDDVWKDSKTDTIHARICVPVKELRAAFQEAKSASDRLAKLADAVDKALEVLPPPPPPPKEREDVDPAADVEY